MPKRAATPPGSGSVARLDRPVSGVDDWGREPQSGGREVTETKIFTVAEAERTLPLVRRVLADLKLEYGVWREAVRAYEMLAAGSRADTGETEDLIRTRTQVTDAAARISAYLLELESIGCQFKGFEEGLVDFYALRDDRLVFLCWKLGEEHITQWHEVDAGVTGRQPIDGAHFSGIIP